MTALGDVEAVLDQAHLALGEFVKGDPDPLKATFSHREDVSLANPFGPPVRGWTQAAETMERAAALYRDGEVVRFENVANCVTPDLAYIVEIERFKARIAGRDEVASATLRVTSILRPEDGAWKLVHRHADPITTPRSGESVIQK